MFAGTALSVCLLVYVGLSLFILSGPYLYVVVCVLYAYNLTLPAVIGLALRNLLYVPSLSCKAVLNAMLAVLSYVCGCGIVCPSISICGSIFIYYKRALRVYGCMRTLRV